VYKDSEEAVKDLFRKTILNEAELAKEFVDKTPNGIVIDC
jgi:N utilization substance protein B